MPPPPCTMLQTPAACITSDQLLVVVQHAFLRRIRRYLSLSTHEYDGGKASGLSGCVRQRPMKGFHVGPAAIYHRTDVDQAAAIAASFACSSARACSSLFMMPNSSSISSSSSMVIGVGMVPLPELLWIF